MEKLYAAKWKLQTLVRTKWELKWYQLVVRYYRWHIFIDKGNVVSKCVWVRTGHDVWAIYVYLLFQIYEMFM